MDGTGSAKQTLDVLLWLTPPTQRDYRRLDAVEVLRAYLSGLAAPSCRIRLHVPDAHTETSHGLNRLAVEFESVAICSTADNAVQFVEPPPDFHSCVLTAMSCDADIIVINAPGWFPYITDVLKTGILLADTAVLKRQAELFVRGHDVLWSFGNGTLNLTWSTFYPLSEEDTFAWGFALLEAAQKRGVNADALETARTLIVNHLPNLCFTRDRLLFYDLQQNAARRANWKRQQFSFETVYYLNFYYLLLYGGFDRIALFLNYALRLGFDKREVHVDKKFLSALETKAPDIARMFTDSDFVRFRKTIRELRNYAAHRGSIMPAKLVAQPDVEPSDEEVDAEIARQGLDDIYPFLPAGAPRDRYRGILRSNTKMAIYERSTLAEGVVKLEIDGKEYMIQPMNDVEWNFKKYYSFMKSVLEGCAALI